LTVPNEAGLQLQGVMLQLPVSVETVAQALLILVSRIGSTDISE
jgi:hypothetical protein